MIRDLAVDIKDFLSFYRWRMVFQYGVGGVGGKYKSLFHRTASPRYFFNRGCFYGCEDDIERFLYFSRAAIEFMYKQSAQSRHHSSPRLANRSDSLFIHDMYRKIGFTKPKTSADNP